MVEETFKDQGNQEYKAGNFLKAAALYTKAIKEDPNNHILYSNRSAALLKLNKVTKAVADAEECVKLKPDWEKGYFRKAAALETAEKYDEALAAYQQAQRLNPENKEVILKIRALNRLVKANQKDRKPKPPEPDAASSSSSKEAAFAEDILTIAKQQIQEHGSTSFPPTTHFMPGKQAQAFSDAELNVRGEHAYVSPQAFGEWVTYLRATSDKLAASAVASIVPVSAVAYPQHWTKPQFPCKADGGVFVQLESRKLRRLWFIEASGKDVGEVQVISYDYALLPTLLR